MSAPRVLQETLEIGRNYSITSKPCRVCGPTTRGYGDDHDKCWSCYAAKWRRCFHIGQPEIQEPV